MAAFGASVTGFDLGRTRTRLAEELARRSAPLSSVLAEENAWADRKNSPTRSVADGSVSMVTDRPDPSEAAWRVGIAADGGLVWRSSTTSLRRQPSISWRQRVADSIRYACRFAIMSEKPGLLH